MAVVTIPVPGAEVVQASVAHGIADAVVTVCRGTVDAVAMVQASVARGIVEVVTTCHGRTIIVGGWSRLFT